MQGLKQRILIATSEDEVQISARRKAAGEKYVATKAEKPKSKKKARRTRI
jgi:hypothetical protein